MSKIYKVVVTGPFNAGKTTFVNTLSDIETVETDRKTRHSEARIKSTTTVALDYGRVKLNRNLNIHLFGTPGQERFEFMRDLLADGMHGFIFLVDSTDREGLKQAANLLTLFKGQRNVPYVLAANKADKKALSQAAIKRELNLNGQPVIPCIATDKASVRNVVQRLITLIET